jgi:hypothetical protein
MFTRCNTPQTLVSEVFPRVPMYPTRHTNRATGGCQAAKIEEILRNFMQMSTTNFSAGGQPFQPEANLGSARGFATRLKPHTGIDLQ